MKKRNFTGMVIVSVFILFFSINYVSFAGETRGVTNDTIKISYITDLTGVAASSWKPYNEAAKILYRFINDQGGINGRKIKLSFEDSRYLIPTTFALFKKVVYRDKVFAILGGGASSAAIALKPQVLKEKIPLLSVIYSERLVVPPNRYIFNTVTTYEDDVSSIFDYIMKNLKPKDLRVGFAYGDNEMGKAGLRAAREKAKAYRVKLYEEVVNAGVLDAGTQVLTLKRNKVKHVIIHQIVPPTFIFLRDARKYAFKADFFGTQVACDRVIVQKAGKSAKNYYASNCVNAWECDVPGMVKIREINNRYAPNKAVRSGGFISGWINAKVLAEGIERAGRDLNAETLVDSLEGLKGYDTNGVTGPITYGPDDRKGVEHSMMYKSNLEKRTLVPITDWIKIER